MIRKDVMIAVVITFCLTATLFMIIPTNSSLRPRDYDPWYDINDDGKIDVKDVYKVSLKYGTSGTPINKTALFLENKTWNYVANFTLSPFSNSSPFFIQGEVWRIKWKLETAWSGSNFYVWDGDDHVLDYVDISLLQRGNLSVSGIHYMPYGKGWYLVETWYINDNVIDFIIESYH